MTPWSGLLPISIEHTNEMGYIAMALNQHYMLAAPAPTTDQSMQPG